MNDPVADARTLLAESRQAIIALLSTLRAEATGLRDPRLPRIIQQGIGAADKAERWLKANPR